MTTNGEGLRGLPRITTTLPSSSVLLPSKNDPKLLEARSLAGHIAMTTQSLAQVAPPGASVAVQIGREIVTFSDQNQIKYAGQLLPLGLQAPTGLASTHGLHQPHLLDKTGNMLVSSESKAATHIEHHYPTHLLTPLTSQAVAMATQGMGMTMAPGIPLQMQHRLVTGSNTVQNISPGGMVATAPQNVEHDVSVAHHQVALQQESQSPFTDHERGSSEREHVLEQRNAPLGVTEAQQIVSNFVQSISNQSVVTVMQPAAGQSASTINHADLEDSKHVVDGTGSPHICLVCNKTFGSRDKLIRHTRIHTGEKPYVCLICGLSFTHGTSLQRHKMKHREEKSYACSVCDKKFVQSSYLRAHMKSHTGEKPYICTLCGRMFSRADSRRRHMKTHTGETPHRCHICGRGFPDPGMLYEHQQTHGTDKRYVCKVCNKGWKRADSLRRHMRTHTGERPYSCCHCGKTFAYNSGLTTHLRTHLEVKPLECTFCSKRFAHPSSHQIHERTHTGEKPYSCTVCEKRFTHSGALRLHIKTHKAELPHTCSICHEPYPTANHMKLHETQDVHEKAYYVCSVCGMGFAMMSSLHVHMRMHPTEKLYRCHVCGLSFTRIDKMRTHYKNQHPGVHVPKTEHPASNSRFLAPGGIQMVMKAEDLPVTVQSTDITPLPTLQAAYSAAMSPAINGPPLTVNSPAITALLATAVQTSAADKVTSDLQYITKYVTARDMAAMTTMAVAAQHIPIPSPAITNTMPSETAASQNPTITSLLAPPHDQAALSKAMGIPILTQIQCQPPTMTPLIQNNPHGGTTVPLNLSHSTQIVATPMPTHPGAMPGEKYTFHMPQIQLTATGNPPQIKAIPMTSYTQMPLSSTAPTSSITTVAGGNIGGGTHTVPSLSAVYMLPSTPLVSGAPVGTTLTISQIANG